MALIKPEWSFLLLVFGFGALFGILALARVYYCTWSNFGSADLTGGARGHYYNHYQLQLVHSTIFLFELLSISTAKDMRTFIIYDFKNLTEEMS